MSREVTIGGDRLGSGADMKQHLHGYDRATFNLRTIKRTTMAPGTLVPLLFELTLPMDDIDMELDAMAMTHPTQGPGFMSFKLQFDAFWAPLRLYNGDLHNNSINIGMNMEKVKFPIMKLEATPIPTGDEYEDIDLDTVQINPSCLLAYTDIRGVGITNVTRTRDFQCMKVLMYWETVKNYYANKQENVGAVIHNTLNLQSNVLGIQVSGTDVQKRPATGATQVYENDQIVITYDTAEPVPFPDLIMLRTSTGLILRFFDITYGNAYAVDTVNGTLTGTFDYQTWGSIVIINWWQAGATDALNVAPQVATFPLENIDTMRKRILAQPHLEPGVALVLNEQDLTPYSWLVGKEGQFNFMMFGQEGLAVKTYQSDLFNNWLRTEWIENAGSIADRTKVSTAGGFFYLDSLNFMEKSYEVLNRIAISGGSYDDWVEAVYDVDTYTRAESPVYIGGLVKEIAFEEVFSQAETAGKPLGTIGGKGVLTNKHKGGKIDYRAKEAGYLMIIASITPRIDYSQGNKWDNHLQTMDDLFKPGYNGIGFQDSINEARAWWDTYFDLGANKWMQSSAGKLPAWINYQTNVNQTYGNFAIKNSEMFMTLNRQYEPNRLAQNRFKIKDLTTYVDPGKYNDLFALKSLDAQNFWIQLKIDLKMRRKMSANQIPNL